jgi:hypothetical protein
MFRIGGSAGTGITSGLDRKPFKTGSDDPLDRPFKPNIEQSLEASQLSKDPRVADILFPSSGGMSPGTLPGFLTQFGLNLLSTPPQGGLLSTAATAAQDPFKTFQAAKLKRTDDRARFARDLFSGDIASQYDLEAQRIKNLKEGADDRKTAEVERGIIISAQNAIFKAQDVLKNPEASDADKLSAERTIKVNQNVLVKELGAPIEFAAIMSSPESFDAEMTAFVNQYNNKQEEKAKDYLEKNPDATPADVLEMFPMLEDGSAEARGLTIEALREKYFFMAEGGRAGFKLGSPKPMMESIAEQPKGEVQDLSYTELRARLPQEISNDIVMLLANSKQALLDFANIQTTEDIASFNQQYDVNLSMPSGA